MNELKAGLYCEGHSLFCSYPINMTCLQHFVTWAVVKNLFDTFHPDL